MKYKRHFILCCALLLSLLGLSLTSCSSAPTEIAFSYGTPSLKRHNVVQTAQKITGQSPSTLKQLTDILGQPPLGTYTDRKGKYCFWQAYEQAQENGFQSANVTCLLNGNHIRKLYMSYFPIPFDEEGGPGNVINHGDTELKDSKLHPGALQSTVKSFQERETQRATALGKQVVFSPSGLNSYLLPPNASVLGWDGDKPNIHYAPEQPSAAETLLNTTNSVLKVINMFN